MGNYQAGARISVGTKPWDLFLRHWAADNVRYRAAGNTSKWWFCKNYYFEGPNQCERLRHLAHRQVRHI